MFPILDLKEKLHLNKAVSIWERNNRTIVPEEIGFKLEVKTSTIQHPEAGNGVFLRTVNGERVYKTYID